MRVNLRQVSREKTKTIYRERNDKVKRSPEAAKNENPNQIFPGKELKTENGEIAFGGKEIGRERDRESEGGERELETLDCFCCFSAYTTRY